MMGVPDKLGLLRLARYLTRNSPRVLMYHRFATVGSARYLAVDAFERQLIHLKKNFNVLPLVDVVKGLQQGNLPPYSAAITIDDCYQDFYTHAWPLLQKHGLPATLYAVTDFVSQKIWLWPDEIRYMLWASPARDVDFEFGAERFSLSLEQDADKETSWEILADHCLVLPDNRRLELIRALAKNLGVEVPALPTKEYMAMTWDQLAELGHAGVEIGAHSVTHPRLTALPAAAAEFEIAQSRAVLEAKLGGVVTSFCYPNGTREDYNDAIVDMVRRSGFSNATVSFSGDINAEGVYAIRRIGVGGDYEHFVRSLSGIRYIKANVLRRILRKG